MNSSDSLDLWWPQPGVIAGMSMPMIHPERYEELGADLNAFQDELPLLWDAGIRSIVCLLQAPGLVVAYAAAGFATHLMPMANGAAPTLAQFREFQQFFELEKSLGHPVAVHCEAGIGRAGVVLAGLLVSEGATPEEAVTRVRALRRGAVETAAQFEFLRELKG